MNGTKAGVQVTELVRVRVENDTIVDLCGDAESASPHPLRPESAVYHLANNPHAPVVIAENDLASVHELWTEHLAKLASWHERPLASYQRKVGQWSAMVVPTGQRYVAMALHDEGHFNMAKMFDDLASAQNWTDERMAKLENL